MTDEALIMAAEDARKNAHAPYSGLHVGAAVLDAAGNVFKGANVENASFGLTICAERTALFSAVSDGALDRGIVKVAVVTKNGDMPCGACRQVLLEVAPRAEVLVAASGGPVRQFKVADLLPSAFEKFDPD